MQMLSKGLSTKDNWATTIVKVTIALYRENLRFTLEVETKDVIHATTAEGNVRLCRLPAE